LNAIKINFALRPELNHQHLDNEENFILTNINKLDKAKKLVSKKLVFHEQDRYFGISKKVTIDKEHNKQLANNI
jgi:hypothetical protein